MAAPMPTARQTPNKPKMKTGWRFLFTFAADPDVAFYEKSGTPPGYDGGDPIDTSTFFNESVRTKAFRELIEVLNSKAKVAYHPIVYNQARALINVETTVTCWLPNGDSLSFFGGLKSFVPTEGTEENQPEAEIEMVATNTDPITGDEEEPNYVTAAGTDV